MLSKETKWYFCVQRPKFDSRKNTKLGYHGNNSSLILTWELILTSQNGNNLWNRGWPCIQNKSRMKLEINYFFWCSYIFICKHTENMQRFATYSLIIDGNGIKQSRLIFWKEIMVSLSKMAKHQLISISALVLGGKGLFFSSQNAGFKPLCLSLH